MKSTPEPIEKVSVILPAAGNAVRMQGTNKTFYALAGEPVLLRTVRLFDGIDEVGEIIIAAKAEDIPTINGLVADAGLHKRIAVTAGGATRGQSVKNGLTAADPAFPFVAIHDAARPLCRTADIRAVLEKAFICGAAALGIPVKDTVKLTENGRITATLPREKLIAIQTPQVFDKVLYQKGLEAAEKTGADYTDDCQLVEALGAPVFVVPGAEQNLKLTTPFDLEVAKLLEQGKRGAQA